MMRLASIALLGVALAAMGCQPPPQPPQAPPAGQMPPGPPPGQGPMAQHPGPGGPWAHPGQADAMDRQQRGQRMQRQGRGDRNQGARMRQNKVGRMGNMPQGAGPMAPGRQPGMMPGLGALGVRFYPPPMLIRRAQDIGLSQDQVAKIRQEVLTTQSKAVDARAKVERARIEVARLLSADKVDEKAVNAQLDEIAKAEAELQKLHIGTMLRVRGLLTAEQRQKLDQPRPKGPKTRQGAAGPGPTADLMDDDEDFDDDDEEDDETDG